MKLVLSPSVVAERLSSLRRTYVPERTVDARARLAGEVPRSELPFERRVARSLKELRALCELATHLHKAKVKTE